MATILSNLTPGPTSSSKDSNPTNWADDVNSHVQAAQKTLAGPLAKFYADAGGHSPASEKANQDIKAVALVAAFAGLSEYKHISDSIEELRWHSGTQTLIQEDWTKSFSYATTFQTKASDILTDSVKSAISTIETFPEDWRYAAAELFKGDVDLLGDFLQKSYDPLSQIRLAYADIKAGKWGIIEKGKDAIDVLYKAVVAKIEELHSRE